MRQVHTMRLFFLLCILSCCLGSCSVWERFFPPQTDGYNDPFAQTRQSRQVEEEPQGDNSAFLEKKQIVKEKKDILRQVKSAVSNLGSKLGNIESNFKSKVPGRGYKNSDKGIRKMIDNWLETKEDLEDLLQDRLEYQAELAEAEMELNVQHFEDYFSDRDEVREQLIQQERDNYQAVLEANRRKLADSLKKLDGRKAGLIRLVPEEYVSLIED